MVPRVSGHPEEQCTLSCQLLFHSVGFRPVLTISLTIFPGWLLQSQCLQVCLRPHSQPPVVCHGEVSP